MNDRVFFQPTPSTTPNGAFGVHGEDLLREDALDHICLQWPHVDDIAHGCLCGYEWQMEENDEL